MAKNLNRCMFIGHLGRDPEMKYTPSGKAVTTFSMAVNNSYTDNEGTKVDETEWVNIKAWGTLAENTNKYLKKGSKVFVSGRLKTRKYEQDGATKYFTEFVADEVEFLDNKGNGSKAEAAPTEEVNEEEFFS